MPQAATVTILVPTVLRNRCDGASELSTSAASVRGMLEEMERRFPELYNCVCDETGAVRRHVNVFVNSDSVRDLKGIDSELATGDVVTIMPAVSGG